MKAKALQFGKAMSAALFVLLLCAVGMTKGYAYDFSTICETGQTLYFTIFDSNLNYVRLVPPAGNNSSGWNGYTKPFGTIVLPTMVSFNGVTYTVTQIGGYAFYGCSDLTGALNIPNTVTSIGGWAFYNCSGFNGMLTIPNSVKWINDRAFLGCSGFSGVLTIPNSAKSIGNFAFSGCSGFTGTLIIPNSVTSISTGAFCGCNGIDEITVESENAFYDSRNNCNAIINTSTNELIFGSKNTIIPNTVSSIGDYAFEDCIGLIGELTLPNSIISIGYEAFCRCRGLTGSLIIPDSVISIGHYAFFGCSGFTGSLTIGNSVISLGQDAFSLCSGLTGTLTIPNSMTSIGSGAFNGCSGLTGMLTIPDSVTSIGYSAFNGCIGLTSLIIGNSVRGIGHDAFNGCIGLTSVVIGNSVTGFGSSAFANCSGLTGTLIIPNSVTSIGNSAFSGCSGLTSLIIGNSVNTIEFGAFSYCNGLSSLTVLAVIPPTLGGPNFTNVPRNIPVYVPCGSFEYYIASYPWNQFVNYIELCPIIISAFVNPDESGTITGAGEFGEGSICTLTATPNEGYTFINWTKDGEEVSTEATYSFTVTEDAEFVANFNPIAFHFTTSGLWSESSNWQSGSLPGFDNEVFIEADCQLDQNTTVNSLTVSNGQSLTLQPNKTLTVTGDLTNTSTEGLVIKDGAKLINASGNVAATMEKDIAAYSNSNPDAWYTIASPMDEMPIEGSGFATPEFDLYRYNESNLTNEEWENYKGGLADFTTFENGRGYLFANSNAFSPAFTGTLNSSAVSCLLSYTERSNDPLSGFNLIGNPFPHDIYKGTGAAIDNANLASGYYTLTNEGTWQVHTFEDAIHPGQGILVKATAPTILTIAKSTAVATAETGGAKRETSPLSISVKGENGQDQAFVYFGRGNSMEKMGGFVAQESSLWVRDNGMDYAIAHVEKADETLELCFRSKQMGDFTLTVDRNETEFEYLQLVDHVIGLTVDLLKQPTYVFHATGQELDARFSIRFKVAE